MNRLCKGCNIEKSLDEFSIKKYNKKGIPNYQSLCKECNKSYQKEHYSKNKDIYRSRASSYKDELRKLHTENLIEYFKNHHCVDCGESNPLVLEFDHIKDKEYNVSRMTVSHTWENILNEISKCEVRCANCHKKKTAKQFDYTMYKMLNNKDST